MARKSPRLTVVITPAAQRDLYRIWDYNVEKYDEDHADGYLRFLDDETGKLETEYWQGKPVPARPGYWQRTMRKGRGQGHIAIYQIREDTVEVLRYFHTAMNWTAHLDRNT